MEQKVKSLHMRLDFVLADNFKFICKMKGMTTTGAVRILVEEFVCKNSILLKDEFDR
jgi:antitoxin component of RelBE/YafQ-DinJ toxin-antitoxin module